MSLQQSIRGCTDCENTGCAGHQIWHDAMQGSLLPVAAATDQRSRGAARYSWRAAKVCLMRMVNAKRLPCNHDSHHVHAHIFHRAAAVQSSTSIPGRSPLWNLHRLCCMHSGPRLQSCRLADGCAHIFRQHEHQCCKQVLSTNDPFHRWAWLGAMAEHRPMCQLVLSILWYQLPLAGCSLIRGSRNRLALRTRAVPWQSNEVPALCAYIVSLGSGCTARANNAHPQAPQRA